MTFSRPDLLWLVPCLPLVVAVGVYRYSRRRRRFLELLGDPGLIQRLGAAGLDAFPTRSLLLVGLAAAALGLAAAGPRWGTEVVESRSRALNLVLAMDVSKSMLARDVEPNRLERGRLLARRLFRELSGDRIGLVAFAGRAYVLSPLTVDRGALDLYVDALDPGMVSHGGSSLASALRHATDLVRGDQSVRGDRVVVLITDGEALEDQAAVLAAAERAARAGVVVHTVGVGTPQGAPVPERDPNTGRVSGYKRDLDGEIVISRLDETLLGQVAARTGGRYVRLDEPRATERLISTLRGMERVSWREGRRVEQKDRSHWFIAAALLLLMLDAVLARRSDAVRAARAVAFAAAEKPSAAREVRG